MKKLSPEDIIKMLNLKPLIPEGGWFDRIWYKPGEVSAIYYFLTSGDFSELHVLPHPEHYFFLMGDPVELYTGLRETGRLERTVLGRNLAGGEVPAFLVESGVIQGSRLVEGGDWALLSTVVSPAYEMDDYRACSPDELMTAFPEVQELVKSLTKSGGRSK